MPDRRGGSCFASANLLFSGEDQGVRAPNPEIPRGSVALVAVNNKEMGNIAVTGWKTPTIDLETAFV
jgi:hypothetical protein